MSREVCIFDLEEHEEAEVASGEIVVTIPSDLKVTCENHDIHKYMRHIAEKKSLLFINGMLVGLFTASHWIQVYDALNEKNRASFDSMSLSKSVEIMWKVVR